ncbi:LOW QUALITY PROTEIN: elongation factor 1-gamma-like [Lingula anatina]|uniref:Elongation factor 1-gamma n=1 Tax=Lingula anatina TaxID=7574 RepID=A0A1S3ICE3_LINAN|nr:LOW QUALITY PROTEIN: elongation factor 1-gamma-like [Lingula anatina]|eukprot:XP_013395930.1 LOW QUALITY PROTEIN: elongation factor 1-gamma-like [Lingula anatina]
MAAGTLYTYPENFRAQKILIAAKYSGTQVTVANDFKLGESNKNEAFLKKFPLGKVPAYEAKNGDCVFESNAIAYYVANEALRGASPSDAAFVQQWINFADSEILPAACTWVFPCMGLMQYNKQNTERAKEDIKKALGVLNTVLRTRTFLVGERVSLADIVVACDLLMLYKMVLDPAFRQPYQNTNRWFTTLVNQPEFKAVLGSVVLCEKMAQFDAKKFAELSGGGKDKGGKKEKKEQQPKQQPKKEKPPAKEKDEEEEPAPKERKDPFADLPKGTFDIEEFKRVYSNNDTATVALPYFWKNFDKEAFSIWHCEYNYPQDLKLTFMSINLIRGFFQRLDRLRKHGFASVILFGESNNSTISGVWVWRGQGLAFDLSPDLQVDYDSYSWKKLDPDSEETKKMVKEYFECEGEFGGKKVCDYKIFK